MRRSLSAPRAKARTRRMVFAGGVIILPAGTEYLNAFWLVLLVTASVAAAIYIYIALRNRPSEYKVAQKIDARLKLADTLSTAAHFLETPGTADAAIRESQPQQALALAAVLLLRYAVLGCFDPHTSIQRLR